MFLFDLQIAEVGQFNNKCPDYAGFFKTVFIQLHAEETVIKFDIKMRSNINE